MIRATVLTTMSRWIAGGGESARIREAIAAMENMEAVEAPYRKAIADKLKETGETLTARSGLQADEAVAGELRAAIFELEATRAKLERSRESRQRRLREARASLRVLTA